MKNIILGFVVGIIVGVSFSIVYNNVVNHNLAEARERWFMERVEETNHKKGEFIVSQTLVNIWESIVEDKKVYPDVCLSYYDFDFSLSGEIFFLKERNGESSSWGINRKINTQEELEDAWAEVLNVLREAKRKKTGRYKWWSSYTNEWLSYEILIPVKSGIQLSYKDSRIIADFVTFSGSGNREREIKLDRYALRYEEHEISQVNNFYDLIEHKGGAQLINNEGKIWYISPEGERPNMTIRIAPKSYFESRNSGFWLGIEPAEEDFVKLPIERFWN